MFCPISVPLRFFRGHKIQNPALHLFRVTGFFGDRGPFKILFPSWVERRNLVREYCWMVFTHNYFISQRKRGAGYWLQRSENPVFSGNTGFWLLGSGCWSNIPFLWAMGRSCRTFITPDWCLWYPVLSSWYNLYSVLHYAGFASRRFRANATALWSFCSSSSRFGSSVMYQPISA